jgi:DNA-binding transcriptional ArsR family regulator
VTADKRTWIRVVNGVRSKAESPTAVLSARKRFARLQKVSNCCPIGPRRHLHPRFLRVRSGASIEFSARRNLHERLCVADALFAAVTLPAVGVAAPKKINVTLKGQGSGTVVLTLDAVARKVCWNFKLQVVSPKPTSAPIHKGPANVGGATRCTPRRRVQDDWLYLRRELLRLLGEREASPSELATELAAPATTVSYHVRKLADLELIELVRTTPRRGATEHHYRAIGTTYFPGEVLAGLPESVRGACWRHGGASW